MSKMSNNGPGRQRNQSGRSGRKGRGSTTRLKEDLVLFGIMIIVISGITGGYFLYSNINSDNSDTENKNLIHDPGTDNSGDKSTDGHGAEPLPDDEPAGNNGNANSGSRTVLLETFTSTQCYWCNAEEEPALKQLAKDYSSDDIVIIAYHGFYGTDPFETIEGNQRAEYYGGISGTPTVWVDGVLNKVGGTGKGVSAMYDVFEDFYNQRAIVSTPVSLSVTASVIGSNIQINADVTSATVIDTSQLTIRFAVLEDGLTDSGKTFEWVVRRLGESSMTGTTLPESFQRSFPVDNDWVTSSLGAAVWIQDNESKEVLQAAVVNIA